MHPLLELLPLFAFFGAYYAGGIYTATVALMIAMPLVALWGRLRLGKFSGMHAASTALVLVFGTLTLALRDERFIQWKPTVLFWALAFAFLASHWVGRRTLTERLMGAALGAAMKISEASWRALNFAWVGFYFAMGALNWWVFTSASQSTWVKFKTFGLTGLTLGFVLLQGLWLARRSQQDPVQEAS